MKSKVNLKGLGRLFTELRERREEDVRQTVLLVDGNFILPNNFALILKAVKEKCRNAKLAVLAFGDKRQFIKDNFPDVEVIAPSGRALFRRYRLASTFYFLLRRNFQAVVISSLDISVLTVALLACRSPLFLHNRWFEWYRVRPRTVSDLLLGVRTVDRPGQRRRTGLRGALKKFGRSFVVLEGLSDSDLRSSVLLVDNGHTEIEHVVAAARRTESLFMNCDLTVLTLPQRKGKLTQDLPGSHIVVARGAGSRYALALEAYAMRRQRFYRVILTSLDITPVAVVLLWLDRTPFLYNRWHQWWSLRPRGPASYLRLIGKTLIVIPLYLYLLAASGLILFKTALRLGMAAPAEEKRGKNGYPAF